ncbi:chorismate lyase [Paraglaciecola sp. L3A3]|uniref:chorismate--pyruvate lyase family protein n=1 Tax=Paraglaciecola sp. L3A3 TaxID=2686358 RepID=UPI001E2FFF1A|nr:chorismate lyase [Paraglaciecola sp. L3A3]
MNSPTIFPVSIPSSWLDLTACSHTTAHLQNWLLDSGSLTEKLIASCTHFHLTVIGEDRSSITIDEFQQVSHLGTQLVEQDWLVREVILWGDGKPWVFARSIIPVELWQRDFVGLNDKPLGQLIFNDARFKRMPFQLTQIDDSEAFLKQLNMSGSEVLWGRRSTFKFEHLKMMVCEVFLPDSPAYQTMRQINHAT